MFFYIKFKYPPITQRQTPFYKLLLLHSPFLSRGFAATDPLPCPAHSPAPSPLTWQIYHLTVGNFTTSLLAILHSLKPKTYKTTHYLTYAISALYYILMRLRRILRRNYHEHQYCRPQQAIEGNWHHS